MRIPDKLPEPLRSRIQDVELVEAAFEQGWPAFHDAEMLRVSLDRAGPSAHLVLSVPWRDTAFEIEMICVRIQDMELSGFNHQNVLFEMVLSGGGEAALELEFHGIYGVSGSVVCEGLQILKVRPRVR